MPTRTITLLSDWGTSDHYAAVVRAKLYAKLPDVRVVDISHSVPRDDIYAAALMAFDTYPYFPEGTVHIIGVDDIASPENAHLLVKFDNHFFIGADNGFFSVLQSLSGKNAEAVYEIDIWQETEVYTFPARDLFPKVAAMLAMGTPPDQIGHPVKFRSKMLDGGLFVQNTLEKDRNGNITGMLLTGRVMFTDGFGNIVTNITKAQYTACLQEYSFVDLRVDWRKFDGKFVDAYMDVVAGDIAFIFLENGFLEISVNRDNAANLLGVNDGAKVVIRFGLPKR
ncbi:MAG: SAM-dependent chlorinase/fluorinase [Bacteroides sp.]|nr:SAM-dependent chlorinase/fluorinase [Bacteroides sp.]